MDWLKDTRNQELLKGLAGNLVGQFAPPGVRDQLQQVLGTHAGPLGADAAGAAVAVEPATYQAEVQAGAAALPVAHQVELGQVLMGALAAAAGDGALRKCLGQLGAGEGGLTPEQIGALALRAQQEHPEALAQAAEQLRERPELLHALLGNQALQGFLQAAAARALGHG